MGGFEISVKTRKVVGDSEDFISNDLARSASCLKDRLPVIVEGAAPAQRSNSRVSRVVKPSP